MRTIRHAVLAFGLLACAISPAQAVADEVRVAATANGNPFTGGLSFAPANVAVPVGGIVSWRNTDFVVPHTVTERHGLWSLTGTWGGTGATPPGFAPGASVERSFEAGTHQYFCIVHPRQMRGTVAVPVDASVSKASLRPATARDPRLRPLSLIRVRWALAPPEEGQVFDVERRRAEGTWFRLRSGTQLEAMSFRVRPGRTYELRARLRAAGGEATDWSPVVTVTS